MSQVKKLKEMGVTFEDPKMWDLLEDLDNMPTYLAEKERKRQERLEFVEKVFGPTFREHGLLDNKA